MECPHCRNTNPAGHLFCGRCGKPIERSCPQCSFANPHINLYCGRCGQALASGAPSGAENDDTPLDTLGISSPREARGERRQATILFSDLAGYTVMAERLDPEEVESIMRKIKTEAERIVEELGGIVNQFVGDEVLALFGIPTAHEDDPVRAVQAAFQLHEMVRNISPEVEPGIGRPIRFHTAINTGLIVTNSRDQRDGTYGITGDTVNTGARLKALSASDTILLAPETQRLVAPFFLTEPLHAIRLKGQSGSIQPFRVLRKTGVSTRFEASEQRGLTRLVGRERELELLQECFQLSAEGKGQVVTVVGEAGLGKSRLIHEFRQELETGRFNLVIGRCTAIGENLSYFPFQDLFKRWFDISEQDTPEDILEKVEQGLLALDPALEEHLPAILHLLSVPGNRALDTQMAGEVIQRRIIAALKACVAAGSREKPLVMIFEDLHWVDERSETAIGEYIEALTVQQAMLVLSYRPEYRPKWGHYGHLTPMVLKPLSEDGTAAILADTFNVETLPEGLAMRVHDRTEGSPFFTEEVAISLEEEGMINREEGSLVLTRPVEELGFPDSVQALVRARIDRLGEAPRETLRLASVVGLEFTELLVKKLSHLGEQVNSILGELKSLELILEKGFQPEVEFMFKHAIIHEVAYASLLLSRRKDLHRMVGLGIEELYNHRLPEYFETLAHHFDQGELWEKAVAYLVKAGAKARVNFAGQTALNYFNRAQEILEKHSPEVPWRVRYNLLFERSHSLGDLGQWPLASQELKEAVEIAHDENAVELKIQALIAWSHAAQYSHNMGEMKDILTELGPLAEKVPASQLGVTALQAWTHRVAGNLPEALEVEKKMRTLIDLTPDSPHISIAKFSLGLFLRWRGKFKECSDILSEVLPQLREAAKAELYLQNVFIHGLALGEQGRYQDAIRDMQEGLDFGLKVGERYSSPKLTNSLGWVYHELCLFDKAIEFNTRALDAVLELMGPETSNLFEIESQTRINLAENHLLRGETEIAREHLDLVYQYSKNPKYFFVRARWKPRCLLNLGELWLGEGDLEKAQAFLDESREDGWIDKFPFRKYQVRAQRLQGTIFAAREKPEEAQEEFRQALEIAEELGNPTQLWRTHQALGIIYRGNGNETKAGQQFGKSLAVVEDIAAGLSDPGLKEGFLNSLPIREVFALAQINKG